MAIIKKHRSLSIILLVMMILTSQLNIGAQDKSQDNMTENNKILESVMIEEEKQIKQEGDDKKDVRLSVPIAIDDKAWQAIEELDHRLEVQVPKEQELSFEKHQYLIEEGGHYYLDFSESVAKPEKFELSFIAKDILDDKKLAQFDFENSPVFKIFEQELKTLLKQIQAQNTEEENPEIKEPENTEPKLPEITEPAIELNGQISIIMNDPIDFSVTYNNKEINASNPIDYNNYKENDNEEYIINLFNKGSNNLSYAFNVKLDEESLNKITEESIKNNIRIINNQDGKQSTVKFENKLDAPIKISDATSGSILVGSQKYFEAELTRTDDDGILYQFNETIMTVQDEETGVMIESYLLQNELSFKLQAYLEEALAAGESLDTIKNKLREGVDLLTDEFKMEDFILKTMPKAELGSKVDYPISINDFMGMGQSLDKSLPVTPDKGINHELTSDQSTEFETITDGFKLEWQGVLNTNRNQTLDKLNLNFEPADIVTESGVKNWEIKTTVNIDYYQVSNDGTLSDLITSETQNVDNEIKNIEIDLSKKENVVAKYTVTQTYVNSKLEEEIEGKQAFKLSANSNGNNATHTIIKTYASAIKLFSIVDDENNPSSLLWSVHFNSNKVIRKAGDGFVLKLDLEKLFINTNGNNQQVTLQNFTDSIVANGKKIGTKPGEDNRFDVTFDAIAGTFTVAVKEGVTVDEQVIFTPKLDYNKFEDLKAALKIVPEVKFEGTADLVMLKGGKEKEIKDIKPATSKAILTIIEKKPLVVDYRTKEIIWGVKVNTGLQNKIALPGLTFYDIFDDKMILSKFDNNNPVLMYRLKEKSSTSDFIKFKKAINEIAEKDNAKPDELVEKFNDLANAKMNEEKEDSKTYGDVIEFIDQNNIFKLNNSNKSSYNNEQYIFAEPIQDGLNNQSYPNVIIDEASSGISKHDKLVGDGIDFRIDFTESNNLSSSGGDASTYYIVYKTKLKDSKEPLDKVANDAGIIFADYINGPGSTFSWVGPHKKSEKALDEVGKYNSLPSKSGIIKNINVSIDEDGNVAGPYESGKKYETRPVVEWTIRFNYDVIDQAAVHVNYTAKIKDIIKKNSDNKALLNINNNQLSNLETETITLKPYEVSKDGKLKEVKDVEPIVITPDWYDDDDALGLSFEKNLSPRYVYEFTYTSLINTGRLGTVMDLETETESIADQIKLNYDFENIVEYSVKYNNDNDFSTAQKATAKVKKEDINRFKKSGKRVSGIGQKIEWTLEFNDSYEPMEQIVIFDKLIGKHNYKDELYDSSQVTEKDVRLEGLRLETKKQGTWKQYTDYTLEAVGSDPSAGLDNWQTGESQFKLILNEKVHEPMRIVFNTHGQVLFKNELPLENIATIEYESDDVKHRYQVKAKVNFTISSTGENTYDKDLHELNIALKYDDNKLHTTDQVDKGSNITTEDVTDAIAVLYRYNEQNVNDNFIYRAGWFNPQGEVTFTNLESGSYIVKQLRAPKDYHIPNSLGFVLPDRNESKDKSIAISQANAKQLDYIKIEKSTGTKIKELFKDEKDPVKAAIFNLTPSLHITSEGNDKNAAGRVSKTDLANIKFNLSDENETKAYSTNTEGLITIGKGKIHDEVLAYNQTYSLTQDLDQDLKGYLLNTETLTSKIEKNPNGTLVQGSDTMNFNNYKVDVQIKNIDRLNKNKTLEGAEFKLYKANDKNEFVAYDKLASNEQVKNNHFKVNNKNTGLKLYNLEPGAYRLEQIKASAGYLLNPEVLEFTAHSNDPHDRYEGVPSLMSLNFDNIEAKLSLTNILHKKAGTEIINDSRFAIFKEGNTSQIADYSLNGGDRINIAPGTYRLKQVKTSFDRPLNMNEISFNIPEVESVFSEETDKNIRTLTFDNHLGNVTIERINHLNESFQVESFELDGNSIVGKHEVNDLTKGKHELKKIMIEDQFIYIDTKPSFNIVEAYTELSELSETVTVYATQARFKFINIDGDTNKEIKDSNAQFSLKQADKAVIKSDSEFIYEYLKPGNYLLSQDQAPTLYGRNTYELDGINVPTQIDESDVTIDKDKGNISLYDIADESYPNFRGKVNFKKISGETNEALAGIEFNLYHNDQLIEEGLSTNSSGMIQLDLLSPGAYYFIETKSDENHLISKEKVAFEIADENENHYPVVNADTLENHYALVKFKNTNPGRDKIYSDALFKLEQLINNQWVAVENYENFGLNQDLDDKYFTIVGLEKGSYRLTQVLAPEKTILNEAVYDFTITDEYDETINKRPLIVLDDYINYKGSVIVDVIDPYGKVQLDINASYSLANETDKTEMTLVNGQLHAENLSPGNYRVYVETVDGAIIVDETVDFEIIKQALNDEKTVSKATLRVTYAYQDISLIDGKDETALESGVWQLNQADWQKDYLIDQKTITMRDLKPGAYSLLQSQAANNYILNSLNKAEFIVEKKLSDYDTITNNAAGYPVVLLEPMIFSNYKQNVIVEKVDEDNNPLAQVGFSLNQGDTHFSDDSGQIIYAQQSPGHYTLKEVVTPEGYQTLEKDYEFVIEAVQAGEPDDIHIKITNNKVVITPEDKVPLIPGLGMNNNGLYLAMVLVILGFGFVIVNRKKQ